MQSYVQLMEDVIEYIEYHVREPLSTAGVSAHFHVSEFHFQRLFKALIGSSLKQYILGRKLSCIVDEIGENDRSLIEISLDYGFEYPEVMSRAFKKQFGMSPSAYRVQRNEVAKIQKAEIVSRTFINHNGGILLKAHILELPAVQLAGIAMECDVQEDGFERALKRKGDAFLSDAMDHPEFDTSAFYTIVACNGDGTSVHKVFIGTPYHQKPDGDWRFYNVLSGEYAQFEYCGDLADIHGTVSDDIYGWIATNERRIRQIGIGMLCVYDASYALNKKVMIHIPVESP